MEKTLLVLVFAIVNLMRVCASAADRPNVLFFITDDESWLERSAYGWSKLPTPHFDRVAKAGVLFTQAYTTAPSCAPSRAAALTGRNFWELKQGAFIQAWLPKEFPVLPDLLAAHGYQVGYTGKVWGPGVYPEQGYQKPADKLYADIKVKPADRIKYISPIDYAANFSVFLEKRKADQPFYFWMGTTEPHAPHAADNYVRLEKEFGFSLDEISMPEFMEDTPASRKKRANFLYEIVYADLQLGKALKSLEDAGELENTIVIVTSDNGTAVGEYGKASPYDWGCHEPLAVMWPKRVPAGRTVTDFVSFVDFAPTILEAAGAVIPATMSGRSFLPLLLSDKSGRVDPGRDFIVTGLEWHGEFDPASRSCRTCRNDRYAYIVRYSNKRPPEDGMPPDSEIVAEELYDMQKDPWQQNNLFNNPEYARIKDVLKARFKQNALKTGDPRVTGDMKIFRETRAFVQDRKRRGYE